MKYAVIGFLILLCGCFGKSPDQTFREYYHACSTNDIETIRSYISSEWMDIYRAEMDYLCRYPEELMEELAYFGISVTEEEFSTWTADDYFRAMVSSPFIKSQFVHGIVVKDCNTDGDVATVTFVRQGEYFQAVLIRELGVWKVTNRTAE